MWHSACDLNTCTASAHEFWVCVPALDQYCTAVKDKQSNYGYNQFLTKLLCAMQLLRTNTWNGVLAARRSYLSLSETENRQYNSYNAYDQYEVAVPLDKVGFAKCCRLVYVLLLSNHN